MNAFYGFKLGQGQDYDSAGQRVPVTLVRVLPAVVVGQRTMEKDHYTAIRVGLGFRKNNKKPLLGLLKNLTEKMSPKYIREIRAEENELKNVGEKIQVADIFSAGDQVDVTGISKGKGFAGVVRRHGFKGGPKTHGQSVKWRHPGSIGQGTTPGRVYKGKKMGGHMGVTQRTVKNLSVFAVKPEENVLLIKGLVPGGKNGLLRITKVAGN